MARQAHEISEVTKVLARNLDKERDCRDWTYADLASRLRQDHYQIQPSDLGKYLRIGLYERTGGVYKEIPADLVYHCARVFETPVEALFRPDHRPEPRPLNWYDPRDQDLGSYAEKLIEHESRRRNQRIKIFGPSVTLRAMPPDIRERYHHSLFDRRKGTKMGRLLEGYNRLGDELQQHYLDFDPAEAPEIVNFVRLSDLVRVILCQPPFDLCRPSDVVSFFEHLRTECIKHRRFRLRLLPDEQLDKHPDLQREIDAWDTIAVIGTTLATRRAKDFIVTWHEDDRVVNGCARLLDRLERLAGYPKLDQCLEAAVKRLRAYEKGSLDAWKSPPPGSLWQDPC
jgi:hypothetical protein